MKNWINKIFCGDSSLILPKIPSNSVDCIITSPPYWGLRDYGAPGQLGLEKTPEQYVDKMVKIFREAKRVLKKEGTLWLNLGDSYVSGKSRYSSVKQTLSGKSRGEPVDGNKPDLRHHEFLKDKDLAGILWCIAFALQKDGWYLRQDIIWHKPNPMPESVTDRCTKSHEYIFLLTKNPKYYFDNDSIRERRLTEENRPDAIVRDREWDYDSKQKKLREYAELKKKTGTWTADTDKSKDLRAKIGFKAHTKKLSFTHPLGRNKRSVWTIPTKPFKEAHFATFPETLIEPMVLAGCPKNGIVLDLFMGAGTTAVVAKKLDRNYIGVEINPEYIKIAKRRLAQQKLF